MDKTIDNVGGNQYFYYLDVLRFIAILLSFLHHSNIIHFVYGHTFFFVLSGFILTYQSNNEYNKRGAFNWVNFTVRRILRIFPLYFIIVLAAYFLIPVVITDKITFAPIEYYLTFTSNYYSNSHIFILTILWSVAVQEQFYLFISLCYKFLNRHLKLIGIVMIISSLFYKIWGDYNEVAIYFHTLNHFSSFGIGIICAQMFKARKLLNTIKKLHKMTFIIGVISLAFASLVSGSVWVVIGDSIVSIIFAYVIFFLCSVKNIGAENYFMRVLTKMGKFSYGLYCFQGVIIVFGDVIVVKYFGVTNKLLLVSLNLILLVLIAYVSYELVEKRVLNLKKHFR